MTRSRPLRAAAALLLPALLAACSSAGGGSGTPSTGATSPVQVSTVATSPTQSSAAALQVTVKDFVFAPASLKAGPGRTVTVTNQDTTAHTLTASDRSFDTGTIAPGATATFTAPQQTGDHPYICTIHPFMHGTLTVA
ncbi:cupredoxin domain-containing protein [Kitasatospora sp. NPDC059648]|uniref:cupredoxin domain-containing protein n=1 Tax=Kitasatospora sp. NPDC059648 TaxID=3346894 RepID=UPI0036B8F43C